jgi:transcriptional regulator with XRE-family HTH domain
MTRLQTWIDRQKPPPRDDELAKEIGISRVQVYRIRSGQSGASPATAEKLERLTGIPWHEFIKPAQMNGAHAA